MFPKSGMQGLLKQAQDMQKKMKKLDEELLGLRITGAASGKLVEVVSNGKKDIISVKINPSILNEDVEMVEDLIMASIKQAYKNVDSEVGDKMNSVTGGMNIPGML